MHSTKTTNITLALAISAALTTTYSQSTLAASQHDSIPSTHSAFLLASNHASTVALSQASAEDQQWAAYSSSQYTYEDADLLASFWGKSTVYEAKLKIGALLMADNGTAVQKALQNAQQTGHAQASAEDQQWAAYSSSQYTYEDADLLASFWGKSTVYEAKLKIGALLMADNGTAAVQKALQNAQQQAAETEPALEDQQWEAYSNSQYRFNDVKLLSQYWGKSSWDTKLKIGSLLMEQNGAAVQKALKNARQQNAQWEAYSNSKYTFDDADLLAAFWGKAEPWEAKLKIGRLLIEQNEAAVNKALQNAREERR